MKRLKTLTTIQEFTDFYPAHNIFDINKYPVRTAVKIFRIENDTLKQKCSGILVSENHVLTDYHCIGEYDSLHNFIFEDSTYIYPVYDNGIGNSLWKTSEAIEYITFKENLSSSFGSSTDIALIKLKDDIGAENGWIGIGFNENSDFFFNNVFHKFSYPGKVDPTDSTRIFNGDTLRYNYGKLDIIEDQWLGYGIRAIPGQSGSSLIYTDNNEYYSVGTLVWSLNSRHARINREIFYSLGAIIGSITTPIEEITEIDDNYHLSKRLP